jgi:hypothetical protein
MLEVRLLVNGQEIGRLAAVRTRPAGKMEHRKGTAHYEASIVHDSGRVTRFGLDDFDRAEGAWGLVRRLLNEARKKGVFYEGDRT